jgi:uncharacterized protein with HEPN domain
MDDKQRNILEHILDEITFVESQTDAISFEQFKSSELMKRAIIMSLLNIGELTNALDFDFYMKHSQIPWRDIIGFRNAAAHGYFSLKLEIVWATIQQDLPQLRAFLTDLLASR